jgi:sugar phosphate permease
MDGTSVSHPLRLGSEAEATYRKITRRIMPLLFLGYLFAFLDRINVGYAQLQMKSALGFSDATYGAHPRSDGGRQGSGLCSLL